MGDGKKYQVLKLVAKGGTAVLYKAIQTSLDRVVAIKRLHQHLTEDENFTRRFVLEAKAAASLDHSNIVKIIDFGTEDQSYYMVMEFIEGESLRELLDKWKQLPIPVALAICYEVLGGLSHAHSKGIVHRDIKPGNIMMTEAGQSRITDFGLAKLLEGATHHTAADTVLGTPLYMSPEQAYGESVDQRSDIFSLGTMLYEMITGIQPFADDNYMGVIQNIAKKNAPHPSKFNIEVPQPVQAILSRAMNKNRDARFQNAGQFRQAIEKYLGHAGLSEARGAVKQLLTTEGATVMLPKTIAHEERKSRLRRGLMAAVVVATLFGAAGIGYTLAPAYIQEQVQATVKSWVGNGPGEAPELQGADTGAAPGNYLATLVDSLAGAADTPEDSLDATANAAPEEAPVAAGEAPAEEAAAPPSAQTTALAVADTSSAPAAQATAPSEAPAQVVEEPPPPPKETEGWLVINSDPFAEVYINNRYRGDTPLEIKVPGGTHKLECRAPNYEPYQESIRITVGELSRRSVTLQKHVGFITITATEGAEVLVDGIVIGVTPLTKPIELDTGRHQITVKKAGFNVWNNQITISAGQEMPLKIVLSPLY